MPGPGRANHTVPMPAPRVLLLGETAAMDAAGIPLPLGGPRRRGMLAFLALRAPWAATRSEIVDALWGEAPPAESANAVQAHVSALRRVLGPQALATVGDGYRLADSVEVDVAVFDRLSRAGRGLMAGGEPAAAGESLRAALALWRGRALADLDTVAFAPAAAALLEEQRLAALESRFDADLATGQPEETLAELEMLLAEHPLRENLAALLIRACHAVGRQADALATYVAVRERLRAELGIEPSSALRDLHRSLLTGTEPPPPSAPPRRRITPVPHLLDETVGREADLAALIRLVTSEDARLVTIIGPGGVGKTRAAIEVGRRLTGTFADGVVYAALADAQRDDDMASVLCSAVGVRVDADDTWSTLELALRSRDTLLICDNVEHVVSVAPRLSKLLASAPCLRILATSRQELGVRAEHQYWLDPLPHTRATTSGDDDEAAPAPAVALFLARTRAAGDRRKPTAQDMADIAAICAACDGLPLAIELAAARARVLSAAELRQRMVRPLPLLVGGRADAPERHRTLSACIAASVKVLASDDRKCLAALSVFHGGFSLEAVSAVTELSTDRALDTLDGLVGRSLVRRRTGADGTRRFDLLQTIREYLNDEADPGHLELARRRHAHYYHRLFGPVPDARSSVRTSSEWTSLLPERPNIRVAIRWTRDVGDAALFADLVHAAGGMWERLGPREEFEEWLRHCLTDPQTSPGRVIDSLIRRVAVACHVGDLNRATADLERARILAPASDELRQAWVLLYEPWLLLLAGDLEGAAEHVDRVRRAVAAAGNPVELRVYHLLLVASVDPDPETARAAHEDLLQLTLAHDLYPLTGTALNISCELDLEQGRYERVLAMAELGLKITRAAEDSYRYGWILSQRGLARLETGDLDGALADLRASLELARSDSFTKGLEDILRLATWCVRSKRHEMGATLLGVYEAAASLVDSADSVLVGRSRRRDLAELPAMLGAGYEAAVQRGRALVAASGKDGPLTATLRFLDHAMR